MGKVPVDFIIKICGLTRTEDALLAGRLGANALGFVFVPEVSRTVTPEEGAGLAAQVRASLGKECPRLVGLFARQSPEEVKQIVDRCEMDIVQIHGGGDADYFRQLRYLLPTWEIWKAVPLGHQNPIQLKADLAEKEADAFVLDVPKGGPLRMFDWGLMAVAQQPHFCQGKPVLLAGGLTAANVGEAIRRTRPAGPPTAARLLRREDRGSSRPGPPVRVCLG